MEVLDAWTNILSESAPPPKEANARFHPLIHSSKAKLNSLPIEAADALGISNISVSVNYVSGIKKTHRRVFSTQAGSVVEFEFSETQLLEYDERYRKKKVNINKHNILSIKIEFHKPLPNYITEDNVRKFAQGMCRGIFLNALIRGKYIKDTGLSRIESAMQRSRYDGRFGTIIASTLNLLDIYSGSNVTFYASISDGTAFLEYSHRNVGKRVHKRANYCGSRGDFFELSDEGLQMLRRGRPLIRPLPLLSDGKGTDLTSIILGRNLYREAFGLGHLGSRGQSDTEVATSYQVAVHPVRWDGELLGGIVQVCESFDPLFFENSIALGTHIAARYSGLSRWVWQMRFGGMIVNPIFSSRDTRILDDQAFLIMPFSESWSGGVEQSVREILKTEGYNVVRADDMFGRNIMEDIWTGIVKSRYVICDTTGRNPNVYYELGMCHAVGKDVILLTQNVSDIPFDVRHLRHIVYENTLEGARKLQRGIQVLITAEN